LQLPTQQGLFILHCNRIFQIFTPKIADRYSFLSRNKKHKSPKERE